MFAVLLLLLCINASLEAFAVSYSPVPLYHRAERHNRFVKGATVYLFHSGTDDIKTTVHVGATLTVYRISPSCEVMPVGIIRVVSFAGET